MTDVSQYNGKFFRATSPVENVMLLEMNRGPVNAFHDAFWEELHETINRVSLDPEVRVIVFASAFEKIFTAGLDLKATTIGKAQRLDAARQAFWTHDHISRFQAAITSLEKCRQPVICAINGIAVGLAIDIASACDIRICTDDATMGILEVKVGLAADIGTLQRFPKIVGNGSKARELALTGRKFYAEEAKEIGFVSQVVSGGRKGVIDAAVKLAAEIAPNSPVAVVSTKHIMNHARDHGVDAGLAYQAAWNMGMLQTKDTQVAMKAQLAKTSPRFPSLDAKL
jgi:delta(3,5)-delta(2,4)-dienoyl-CoA isomerase